MVFNRGFSTGFLLLLYDSVSIWKRFYDEDEDISLLGGASLLVLFLVSLQFWMLMLLIAISTRLLYLTPDPFSTKSLFPRFPQYIALLLLIVVLVASQFFEGWNRFQLVNALEVLGISLDFLSQLIFDMYFLLWANLSTLSFAHRSILLRCNEAYLTRFIEDSVGLVNLFMKVSPGLSALHEWLWF